MDFILDHCRDVVTAGMVADSLGLDRKVTGTLLARLSSDGRIAKVGRGRYSASSRAPRNRKVVTRPSKRISKDADDRWGRALELISKEVEGALGASAGRIVAAGRGMRRKGPRAEVEMLVARLREGLGSRLALDMVQPILEQVFGDNGEDMALRLCFPDCVGGGG
jgi:hypothetical protein